MSWLPQVGSSLRPSKEGKWDRGVLSCMGDTVNKEDRSAQRRLCLQPPPQSPLLRHLEKGCADPAQGARAGTPQTAGPAYTTVRMPVAVKVCPLSWTMGSTRLCGLGLLWNLEKVKCVSRRFEYCIRENCGSQGEALGSGVVILCLVSFLCWHNSGFTNHGLCVFEAQQIHIETQKKRK